MTKFKDRKDFEEKLVKAFLDDVERLEKARGPRKPGMLFWGQGGPAFEIGNNLLIPQDNRSPEQKQKEMEDRAAAAAKEKEIRAARVAEFNAEIRAEREAKEKRVQERNRIQALQDKHGTSDWRVAPEVHPRHEELKQHLMTQGGVPEHVAHAKANQIISGAVNGSMLARQLNLMLGKK